MSRIYIDTDQVLLSSQRVRKDMGFIINAQDEMSNLLNTMSENVLGRRGIRGQIISICNQIRSLQDGIQEIICTVENGCQKYKETEYQLFVNANKFGSIKKSVNELAFQGTQDPKDVNDKTQKSISRKKVSSEILRSEFRKIEANKEPRNLKKGCEGKDVSHLQELLIGYGYSIRKSGVYDDETLKAVKDFQRKHDLDVDGVVGKYTMEKLNNSSNGNTTSNNNQVIGQTTGKQEEVYDVKINYYPNANKEVLTPYTLKIIEKLAKNSDNESITITSTIRTTAKQAQLMYDNSEGTGVNYQIGVYSDEGDEVLRVYKKLKAEGKSRDEIIKEMEKKIIEVGSTKVSKHCYSLEDYKKNNTFDITCKENLLENKDKLKKQLQKLKDDNVLTFAEENGCFHVRIYNSDQK